MQEQGNGGNMEMWQPESGVKYTFADGSNPYEQEREKKEKKYYFTGMLTGIFLSLVLVCGGFLIWSVVKDKDNGAASVEASVVNTSSPQKLEVLQ